VSELIYVGILCGIFGVFVGAVLFSELWARILPKPGPELRSAGNRFDFLQAVPAGNSIFEVRRNFAGGGESVVLRLDAYTLLSFTVTQGKIRIAPPFEIFVDGRRQTPPPDPGKKYS